MNWILLIGKHKDAHSTRLDSSQKQLAYQNLNEFLITGNERDIFKRQILD